MGQALINAPNLVFHNFHYAFSNRPVCDVAEVPELAELSEPSDSALPLLNSSVAPGAAANAVRRRLGLDSAGATAPGNVTFGLAGGGGGGAEAMTPAGRGKPFVSVSVAPAPAACP